MTRAERMLWIDVVAARYFDAVDGGDVVEQLELWKLAAQDADLEAAFREVHDALLDERHGAAASAVADSAARHLTSGEVLRPTGGPVTFADVADELYRHTPDRLPADAHRLNEKLRQAIEPLPADLGLTKLIELAEAKFGAASRDYWKAFREAALTVRMRANSATADYALAARRGPKPEGGA